MKEERYIIGLVILVHIVFASMTLFFFIKDRFYLWSSCAMVVLLLFVFEIAIWSIQGDTKYESVF